MIYHVYANKGNIGDWLSAKGIQKLLSPLPITECLCDEPFIEETIYTLSLATENDFIVIGGGGLLMDYFVPFWKEFNTIARRVPFVIWGVGCCDLKQEPSLPPRKLIEDIANKSKLCIIRDDITRKFLSNCKIPDPVPCPSINVIEPVNGIGRDILHVNNYSTAGAETYDVMRLVGQNYADKNQIVFRETNNRIEPGNTKQLNNVLKAYATSGIILSSALHGCIIAVAMGLKVVAVSGDRKIEGFMKTVGLNDWVLEVEDVAKLSDKIMRLDEQSIDNHLLENCKMANQKIASEIRSFIAMF